MPVTTELGVYPCSMAAAKSRGLNAEPGWRFACVARLNELLWKSRPPTSARTSPVLRVDRHERAFEFSGLVDLREPLGDGVLGVLLNRHVDRGVDFQAALQHVFGAKLLHHLTPYRLHEVQPAGSPVLLGVRRGAVMNGRI